jgi:hypothetical protein
MSRERDREAADVTISERGAQRRVQVGRSVALPVRLVPAILPSTQSAGYAPRMAADKADDLRCRRRQQISVVVAKAVQRFLDDKR